MEKRVPAAIVVHLARAEDHTAEGQEMTYTDNISAHGACVISSRRWKPGEVAEVTSLNERITLLGRVTYCQTSRGAVRHRSELSRSRSHLESLRQICRSTSGNIPRGRFSEASSVCPRELSSFFRVRSF